jgi:pyridoxamine 5'-phosphate oxidase family protein
MSVFTPSEVKYLTSQHIGRVATVSATGEPHVVPVRFRYNPELDVIEIGGHNFGKSKKFRDAMRNGKVAIVVDDTTEARKPRGVEVRGRAEAVMEGGGEIFRGADPEFIRITPTHIASWGVDSDNFTPISRNVG